MTKTNIASSLPLWDAIPAKWESFDMSLMFVKKTENVIPRSWIWLEIEVKMQPRLMALEEGKDLATTVRTYQPRALPLRVLQFFLVFLVLGLGVSVCSMYMIRFFKVPNAAPVVQPTIVPSCFVELDSLQSWIRPPTNLLHIMNDAELLWRASFVPQIKSYPFDRVPKIAFMFLTKGPLPMAPLWERFFKGHDMHYSIYVHAMPSYDANYPPSSVFYRRQIPSQVSEIFGYFYICLVAWVVLFISSKVISLITIIVVSWIYIKNCLYNYKLSDILWIEMALKLPKSYPFEFYRDPSAIEFWKESMDVFGHIGRMFIQSLINCQLCA